jgi:hypothetical protein
MSSPKIGLPVPPPASRDDFYTVITLKGSELKMLLG